MREPPFISCIMPTANRRAFVAQAIGYFLRQDYEHKELIIVDDGDDAIGALVAADERVRYIRLQRRASVGAKRNLACEAARGELIAHWDDDDWHAPHRLRYQVDALVRAGAELCGISTLLFYEFGDGVGRGWKYVYPALQRAWLSGSSLCYTREFWAGNRFRDLNVGEDARFVWNRPSARICALPDPAFHVGIIHKGNVSPKNTAGSYWQPHPAEDLRRLMGADVQFYDELAQGGDARQTQSRPLSSSAANADAKTEADAKTNEDLSANASVSARASVSASAPAALVTAAYGIGDLLRVTPLVRVLARLGYQVDLLVAPDYAESARLFEGAAEMRRLFCYQNFRSNKGSQPLAAVAREVYELATFTHWSAPLGRWIKSRRALAFEQAEWLKRGDIACVERMARTLGWRDELPEPFAVASGRRFDLAPRTIALHPGCKPDWPWKKWHGFDALARLWPEVAVVGTDADLRNEATYFRRDFEWPEHARNFVGALDLPDTAALLSQCAALVSNDSGMMHLGVAVGTPTFGLFGITSPEREMIPSKKMFPVTKELACEAACRRGAWGRRDCERHLECLKTLSPEELLARVRQNVPALAAGAPRAETLTAQPASSASLVSPSRRREARDELHLAYYGYVFDASGYGQAARGYIHALERAGVKLSIVDLAAGRPRQVRDELVEARIAVGGRVAEADAHLFHGIPPQWARRAAHVQNAIGMTVWETDAMPAAWRNSLKTVREVWLPCDYNVSVFGKSIDKPLFKLPHPLLSVHTGTRAAHGFLKVAADDFVFYSIFQWQERKSPRGLLESFLRAFPRERDAVLVLKVNREAERVAARDLEEARRATLSRARVEIHSESWPVEWIEALHARGNCYVSLHRGEGWCYPLFEAASRGTPVVATSYSGPLEYLDADAHGLVRHALCPVRQSYIYYHPRMRWAEPDLAHASELMRRAYREREATRAKAESAACRMRQEFSLERVGERARARLEELLGRGGASRRGENVDADEQSGAPARLAPAVVPIAGEWYDADYFEYGRKSNWERGYSWALFGDLFKRTARFLADSFPEAGTFLDAGCAKGFMVRALREAGKQAWGFDHSRWAIDHAEASVKSHLTLARAESVEFAREFDVTLAFSLCESLTEEQAHAFLTLARGWTRQAIIAVIPSFENDEEEKNFRARDRDYSHITMRRREWWHAEFLRAGWRQDALHRIVWRACQQHELPRRMNWKIYVYAPD